jgi:hypothetical protein
MGGWFQKYGFTTFTPKNGKKLLPIIQLLLMVQKSKNLLERYWQYYSEEEKK